MTETSRRCSSCGAKLHGAYCSNCGIAAERAQAAPRLAFWPYVIGASFLALVGAIVMTRNGGAAVSPVASVAAPAPTPSLAPPSSGTAGFASAPGGTPPDLSAMTPVEQFDRLFDRVMRASEGGDTAAVTTFAPMALVAFAMLESPDADARFHAGLIRVATGDLAGARALADSIAAEQPAHLFGILLKGKIAEHNQDLVALKAAHQEFLRAYPTETAARRPEYPGHQVIIDRFLQDASPDGRNPT